MNIQEIIKKYKFWVLGAGVLIIILVGMYFAGRLSTKKERDLSKQNLAAMQDSVKTYKIKVKGLVLQVFEKDALILTKNDAIKLGLIEKEYWRKLHLSALVANVKLEGELKAAQDSLALPPEVKFITVNDSSGIARDYVKIPFTLLAIKDPYLNLGAGMNVDRTAWYKLDIPIVGTVTIGYKGKKAVGVFTTENTLLNITNMNIVIVPYKSKWYESKWISAAAGFVAGYGVKSLIK